MTLSFCSFSSGSSGNCYLVKTETTAVLIDAGISASRIVAALHTAGTDPDAVSAILLTHEHSDHIKGLCGMSRLEKPVFFATSGTADAAKADLKTELSWQIFRAGDTFAFRDLSVTTFSIPHDAADPVAYSFSFDCESGTGSRSRQTVAWVTDLGYAPQLVRQKIKDANVLVLEANYDRDLLENSGRPLSLKQRIRGRHGHLSNEDTLDILLTLESENLRHCFLAHLSDECHSTQCVYDALFAARAVHPNCTFTIVPSRSEKAVSLFI